jgi:cell division protein FtsL
VARAAAAAKTAPARRARPRKATRRASGPAKPSGRSKKEAASARMAGARMARPATAGGAVALPLPVRAWNAPFARGARARGGAVLDALLAGRGWIALIGVLLAGIVFFNVDLLRMNRDIAADAERISALKRQNADLRLESARLGSSERIQDAAARLGLVLPLPGDIHYLRPGAQDAKRALGRIGEPPVVAPVTPVVEEETPVVPDETAVAPEETGVVPQEEAVAPDPTAAPVAPTEQVAPTTIDPAQTGVVQPQTATPPPAAGPTG